MLLLLWAGRNGRSVTRGVTALRVCRRERGRRSRRPEPGDNPTPRPPDGKCVGRTRKSGLPAPGVVGRRRAVVEPARDVVELVRADDVDVAVEALVVVEDGARAVRPDGGDHVVEVAAEPEEAVEPAEVGLLVARVDVEVLAVAVVVLVEGRVVAVPGRLGLLGGDRLELLGRELHMQVLADVRPEG